MNTTLNRVYGLDILKALCAFCVIMIHAPFPGTIGICAKELSRIAVPIFFMITGYFYTDVKNQNRELAQIKKIFSLCFFSNILYFLWKLFLDVLYFLWQYFFVHSGYQFTLFLFQTANKESLLKFFIFNVPLFSDHLWYLCAVLYVLIIVYFLNRVFPKYSSRILLIVTPFLLLINLTFGNYSQLLLKRTFSDYITRNFLFVGIPYFTIGFYLRKHKKIIAAFSAKHSLLVLLTLFFALSTIIDRYLLCHFGLSATSDHALSITFLSILVFVAFTSTYWNGKMSFLYNIGRKYSTFIYIFHPILITVLSIIAHRLQIDEFYTYCCPVVVYFTSILIGMLYLRIQSNFGSKVFKLSQTEK